MISKKTRKILIKSAIFSILLLLSVFLYVNYAKADDATVEQNNAIKQFHFPWSETSGIAGLVKQIYLMALGLVGALALGMIVFGGVQYAASAGNPSRQTDARDRITQAIWGVVLLLCAYLIFNTINPDLLKLKEPIPSNNPSSSNNPTTPTTSVIIKFGPLLGQVTPLWVNFGDLNITAYYGTVCNNLGQGIFPIGNSYCPQPKPQPNQGDLWQCCGSIPIQ